MLRQLVGIRWRGISDLIWDLQGSMVGGRDGQGERNGSEALYLYSLFVFSPLYSGLGWLYTTYIRRRLACIAPAYGIRYRRSCLWYGGAPPMYEVHSPLYDISVTRVTYIHAHAKDKVQNSEHSSSLLTLPPRIDAAEPREIETGPVLCRLSRASGRR